MARFAEVVAARGAQLAVDDGEGLDYRALDQAANGLAARLLSTRGTGAEPVALLCAQGSAFVVAVLAVLKAGKIFAPLDPRAPAAIERVLDDLDAGVILHDAAHAALAARFPRCQALSLAPPWPSTATPPGIGVDPRAPAFVYFTTGTTGAPKGVVDCTRNLVHNAWRYTRSLAPRADDRFSMIQSPSFSGCLSSLFTALLNGATLCPFDLDGEGMAALPDYVAGRRISIFHGVPALFLGLARPGRHYPSVRIVRLEGDRPSAACIDAWRRHFPPRSRVIIGLGATECGLARRHVVDADHPPGEPLPLGQAVDDVVVRIVDEQGAALPAGSVGEILVEGDYLANGYWRRDDLTRTAFTSTADGRRAWRGGDLGRLDQRDCLHYVGRRHGAPRVHGRVVDPAPLVAAARRSGLASDAVLASRDDALVLYYLPSGPVQPPLAFARALAAELADSPVDAPLPRCYVDLDALPLSADGKLAMDRLPAPAARHQVRVVDGRAPAGERERLLARAWSAVLGIELGDAEQNVFALGVDSLHCAQFLAHLHDHHGIRLGVEQLFAHTSVAALARCLDGDAVSAPAPDDHGEARRAALRRRRPRRQPRPDDHEH